MVVWQDEQVVLHELLQDDARQSAIPVLFQIPYECQRDREPDAKHLILWQLGVTASRRGLATTPRSMCPCTRPPRAIRTSPLTAV